MVFLVFTMGKNSSGLTTLLDEPVPLDPERFELDIETVVTEALDSYQSSAPATRVWRAPEGNAGRFIKKHLCVSVERLDSGDLKVQPLHHQRGGYVGREGEHIIIRKQKFRRKSRQF